VVQEWWGLDAQTIAVAERFAEIGYLAFAPDLFRGESAALGDHEKASSLVKRFAAGAPMDLQAAFDGLRGHRDGTGKVGCVGFCFGGRMTLLLAMARPLDAACTFYGGGMQQVFGTLDAIKCPVLGLFGDKDDSIPVGTVAEFDRLLDVAGVQHEVVVYPDAGHAFFRDSDPAVYRPAAAGDAWDRVKRLFAQHLR
jgi:carboxymethylenebutenolidase